MASAITDSLASSEARLFDGKLPAGEALLWVGRPLTGRYPTRLLDYILWGVVLLVTLFLGWVAYMTIFMLHNSTGEQKMTVLAFTFAVPFAVFWAYRDDIRKRNSAVFAITPERIVMLNEASMEYNQIGIAKLKALKHKPRPGGRGSVQFMAPIGAVLRESSSRNRRKTAPPNLSKGLPWIENSEEVFALIQELKNKKS